MRKRSKPKVAAKRKKVAKKAQGKKIARAGY